MALELDFSKLSGTDILDMAIAIEDEAQLYYEQLADWVKKGTNGEAADFFNRMATREERRRVVHAFMNDPEVMVLIANDAAGEGVNLQRAHLMINYDLPWNPNRLEQRFGRIHRIGQREVCHLRQQPTGDQIADSYAENIAAFKFVEYGQ